MRYLLLSSGLIWTLSISTLSAPPPVDLADLLKEILRDTDVPAMAGAVVIKDDIVAAGASGLRKAGDPAEVTLEDKFHIGSNTKAMTATLAAILVRKGLINWDTTVAESFDDLRIDPGFRSVTLEQLLSNTGGCPKDMPREDWRKLFTLRGALPRQRTALAKMILTKEPAYPPGEDYKYSNAGFALGGAMLERAARTSYEDLMKEHLFAALGMESAGFRAPGRNGKVDQPYGHVLRRGRVVPVDPEPRGDNPNAIAPAGLVHCNILDLAKFARAHLGHGPEGFLTPAELANLHKPRSRKEQPYALGWIVTERQWSKGPALTHVGSNTMWYCVIWIAPNRNLAVVTASNSGSDEGFTVCDKAVAALLKRFLPD